MGKLSSKSELKLTPVIICLIFAILTGTVLSINHIDTLEENDLKKSLTSILEAVQVSLNIAREDYLHVINGIVKSKSIKTLMLSQLDNQENSNEQRNEKLSNQLLNYLESDMEAHDLLGFIVFDMNSKILASHDSFAVGGKVNNDKFQFFIQKVSNAQKGAMSLPLRLNTDIQDRYDNNIGNTPVILVGAPIYNKQREVMAGIALLIRPSQLYGALFERGRFGETGETYAFNKDAVMISESRFTNQIYHLGLSSNPISSILATEIRNPGTDLSVGNVTSTSRENHPLTKMAESATQGMRGVNVSGYRDYRGVIVVGAWVWDNTLGFGITTEVDKREAYSTHLNVRVIIVGLSVFSTLILLMLYLVSKRDQKTISESLEKSRLILSSAGEGIYGLDRNGQTTFVNPAACRMLGFEEHELIGMPIHSTIHHSYPSGVRYPWEKCPMNETISEGKIHTVEDEVLWRKDGSSFPVRYTSVPIRKGRSIKGAVVTFTDITQRRKTEEALAKALIDAKNAKQEAEKLAVTDGLTKVPNRRAFDELILLEWKKHIKNKKPLSIVMIDIDFFKKYNDGYGHAAGDAALQKVATSIEGSLKKPSDFVARYGGEEFVLLLHDTDVERGQCIAEKVRQCVEIQNLTHEYSEVANIVTISLGGVTSTGQFDLLEDCLKLADESLYKAKEDGRNQVVWNGGDCRQK